MNYDLIVIGSGPGGYVAAIRASQLGLKTAVVEKENLGGVCLNWGCIPTKALMKSAQVYNYMGHAKDYGIKLEGTVAPDFPSMISRSREVADAMSRGVQFLFRKNKVDTIEGFGRLTADKKVEVEDKEGKKATYEARNIIIATGARARELPTLPIDNEKIIGYRKALTLEKQPESMVIVAPALLGLNLPTSIILLVQV